MERRCIVVIGQLPPPVSGFSYITAQMIDLMRYDHDVHVHDIAAHRGSHGLLKHLSRVANTILSGLDLARRSRAYNKACYIACEGNFGLIYMIFIVGICRLFRYKTYLHHHSFGYINKYKFLVRLLLHVGADLTHLFLSPVMRNRFEARYGRIARSQIVSNAAFVAETVGAAISDLTDAGLVIGHLSNLSTEKGVHLFLNLLRDMVDAGANIRGILAGPVMSVADRKIINAATVDPTRRLDYRGPVYGSEKDKFFADIDIFVFPSVYANEAQPVVLFEALAAGCQIIAYDRGCIAEQVGRNGFVIAQDEPFVESARDWLASVAADRCERDVIRNGIRARFCELRNGHVKAARSIFFEGRHFEKVLTRQVPE